MEITEFIQSFADQFDETDPSAITLDCHFKDLDEWSSLTVLGIIAFVKTDMGKTITGQEIRNCETVRDLYELIKSK